MVNRWKLTQKHLKNLRHFISVKGLIQISRRIEDPQMSKNRKKKNQLHKLYIFVSYKCTADTTWVWI